MYKKWEYIGTKIALKSLLSNWKYRKPPKVWNIMSSRHDELTQHPQVTPSKAPPCSTAETLCLEQTNTVRLARYLFSIRTKRFEGFRDACVVQISFIEFLKVHVTSTLWTETQTTTEYYKTSSCIKLDTSLYRACWPLSFFFPTLNILYSICLDIVSSHGPEPAWKDFSKNGIFPWLRRWCRGERDEIYRHPNPMMTSHWTRNCLDFTILVYS